MEGLSSNQSPQGHIIGGQCSNEKFDNSRAEQLILKKCRVYFPELIDEPPAAG
jgi:hypothetical protein